MKKFIFLIFLFLINPHLYSQSLTGYIFDLETEERIEGAHIQIARMARGTNSGANGVFSITVKKSDTITITMVGYHTKKIIITNSFFDDNELKVGLLRSTLELEEIVVNAPLPSPIIKKPEEIKIKMPAIGYNGPPKPIYAMTFQFDHPNKEAVENGMIPVLGPGGKIYGFFSYLFIPKEREKKKLAKIKNNQDHFSNYQVLLIKKIPDRMIKKSIDIEEEEIMKFRFYLDFSREFLLKASEYDKILAIQKSYIKYKQND